jgi:tetratricopeptide (TPR) repeat protein
MRLSTLLLSAALMLPLADSAAQRAAQRTSSGVTRGATVPQGPAMRQAIYSLLRDAQSCVEREDLECAQSFVDEVQAREDLNSYERAQAWNFQAFIDFENDDLPAAIESYERLLAEDSVPPAMQQSTRYSLATLLVKEARYDDGLAALDAWADAAEKTPGPEPLVLRSQLQYERGAHAEGLAAIDAAIDTAAALGAEPEEGWYRLKLSHLWELGDEPVAADTLEEMIRLWPKPEYFIQLAGVYGDLGREVRQLELYEAVYASGWLETEARLVEFASLLLGAERADSAVAVLEQGFERGQIEETDENFELLARAAAAAGTEPDEP